MRDDKAKGDVSPRVLVVEDEENVRELLLTVLAENGYRVEAVRTGEEGLRQLDSQLYDLVLLDLNLPGMHGLNVLGAGTALQTDAQFIVMTAFGSIDSAVEAMKLGAVDFIKKPFRTEELLHVLTRAMEELELKREVAQLRSQSSAGVRSYLVGKSQAMQRVFGLIERVAPTRANVLISGDTGTGKELVARAVHDLSGRSRRPFVAINCSALPETLLESELFGHMKGSFTGAVQSKRGLFEEAQGGSIFLDEISTVSEGVQIKLLRVLQDRKVTRVGGREPITVDFRLIAATNRDLGELVEHREFREDLFYRLNVFPIRVPPLRERRDDIPLLAQHFRQRFAEENGLEPPGAREFHRTGCDHARRCPGDSVRAAGPASGSGAQPAHEGPRRKVGPGASRARVYPRHARADAVAPEFCRRGARNQQTDAVPEAEAIPGTGNPPRTRARRAEAILGQLIP